MQQWVQAALRLPPMQKHMAVGCDQRIAVRHPHSLMRADSGKDGRCAGRRKKPARRRRRRASGVRLVRRRYVIRVSKVSLDTDNAQRMVVPQAKGTLDDLRRARPLLVLIA